MLPKPPPREGQVGFLYLPPYRVQGASIAGEDTCVQVPELDVAFDIGRCLRVALPTPFIALSHPHMDHLGGLPYYFSQRTFHKMGTGTCVCHAATAPALRAMMQAWIPLEAQRTPHTVVGLEPGEQIELKNNILLRAVATSHTVPSLGYIVLERRTKLKEEFHDVPQTRLRELKSQGVEITRVLEIPLVAYTGDTELCPSLLSDEFARARIVITECTFFEREHRDRSKVGKHLHADDLAMLLAAWQAEAVVVVHVSRRTNLSVAREQLERASQGARPDRVHFLMDHRANRLRYEKQCLEAGPDPATADETAGKPVDEPPGAD